MPISECREKEINMHWNRAKNIILVLLVSLNLFLFVNIMIVKKNFELTGTYRNNALKALTAAGVELNCSVPFSSKPVQRISFVEKDKNVYTGMIESLMGIKEKNDIIYRDTYHTEGKTLKFEDNRFVYTDNTNSIVLPVENHRKLDASLKSWIRKNRISKDKFVLDKLYEEDGDVIAEYVQLYRNIPVLDNKIVFRIRNKALAEVEGSLRIFYDLRANKEDYIVSAEIVLLTNKDRIKGKVEAIDLGYLLAQKDELYDTPVWRVKLSSDEEILFNAFTGEWIDIRRFSGEGGF